MELGAAGEEANHAKSANHDHHDADAHFHHSARRVGRAANSNELSPVMCVLIVCGLLAIAYFTTVAPPAMSQPHPVPVHPTAASKARPAALAVAANSSDTVVSKSVVSDAVVHVASGPGGAKGVVSGTSVVGGGRDAASANALQPPSPHHAQAQRAPAPPSAKPASAAPPPHASQQQQKAVLDETNHDAHEVGHRVHQACSQLKAATLNSHARSQALYRTAAARLLNKYEGKWAHAYKRADPWKDGDLERLWQERECWQRLGSTADWLQDVWLYQNLFQFLPTHGTFLDFHAHNGVTHSTTHFLEGTVEWSGVCVEPSLRDFTELLVNRPRCVSIQGSLAQSLHDREHTTISVAKLVDDQEMTRINLYAIRCNACYANALFPLLDQRRVAVDVVMAERERDTEVLDTLVKQMLQRGFFLAYVAPDLVFVNRTLAVPPQSEAPGL